MSADDLVTEQCGKFQMSLNHSLRRRSCSLHGLAGHHRLKLTAMAAQHVWFLGRFQSQAASAFSTTQPHPSCSVSCSWVRAALRDRVPWPTVRPPKRTCFAVCRRSFCFLTQPRMPFRLPSFSSRSRLRMCFRIRVLLFFHQSCTAALERFYYFAASRRTLATIATFARRSFAPDEPCLPGRDYNPPISPCRLWG